MSRTRRLGATEIHAWIGPCISLHYEFDGPSSTSSSTGTGATWRR
ncbi:MAG: hypothetical protein WKF43_12275 [Acidimicrobiales bacterium]